MRKYDEQFKQQAVKKVFDEQSVASGGKRIGVAQSLVHKWKRAALNHAAQDLTGAELKENAARKKRVKELEQENEILKKAALITGCGS